MKKIILLVMMLLLVGCQSDTILTYEKMDSVVVQWGDGVSYIVDDQKILDELHDLLNNSVLLEAKPDEIEGYLYFIDISGDKKIRIVNGLTVRIDDKDYAFEADIIEDMESILENYIAVMKDGHLVSKVTPEVEATVEEDNELQDVDINSYTLAGQLNDGSEVYYLDEGDYFKLNIVSEILIKRNDIYHLIDKGALSVPTINPSGNKIAYVNGIGFEENGTINIYQDGQLSQVVSEDIVTVQEKSRTIKSCIWLDDNRLISIIGFDTGTITQGGDVYSINVETGDLKLLIDTKDGKEVVLLTIEDDLLNYEVVTWIDRGYMYYTYEIYQLEMGSASNQFPVIIEWVPWNLEIPYLSEKEILSFELFDSTILKSDLSHLEFSEGAYHDENIDYSFTEFDDSIWRIDVIGKTDYDLPRGLKVGQTLEDVLNKFPHEKNYLKSEGVFYGERSESTDTQDYMGSFSIEDGHYKLFITTKPGGAFMAIYFEKDTVSKIEVYFYNAN
ncbi:MAG: DUF4652 domain-containing protein [Clostridiales bacterium]|nr:DUF4652 domain-containing protein [Clostridiales bacterium]